MICIYTDNTADLQSGEQSEDGLSSLIIFDFLNEKLANYLCNYIKSKGKNIKRVKWKIFKRLKKKKSSCRSFQDLLWPLSSSAMRLRWALLVQWKPPSRHPQDRSSWKRYHGSRQSYRVSRGCEHGEGVGPIQDTAQRVHHRAGGWRRRGRSASLPAHFLCLWLCDLWGKTSEVKWKSPMTSPNEPLKWVFPHFIMNWSFLCSRDPCFSWKADVTHNPSCWGREAEKPGLRRERQGLCGLGGDDRTDFSWGLLTQSVVSGQAASIAHGGL